MIDTSSCPTPDDWQRMLSQGCDAACELRLRKHMAECATCFENFATLMPQMSANSQCDVESTLPETPFTLVCDANESLVADNQFSDATLVDNTIPPVPQIRKLTTTVKPLKLDFLRPKQQPDELGRLGSYRVLEVLGMGGMGVVFKAEDISLKRLVALKVMKRFLASHDTSNKRFLREAQSAAAINHEHVVRIYQVNEDNGVPYLAMELLVGETLDAMVGRLGRLSLAETLRIGRQIASGLSAAHRRGLIHRDIKPANIILEPIDPTEEMDQTRLLTHDSGSQIVPPEIALTSGAMVVLMSHPTKVKLVDFGLARATDEDSQLTQSGVVTGTPQYMSPEQAEGHDLDQRSDLFSLGCVMYRMLCGETAFSGRSSSALLLAIVERPHKPIRDHLPDVSPRVEAVIDRLLAKNPNDRFPTAIELMQTLVELERHLLAGKPLDGDASSAEISTTDGEQTAAMTVIDLQVARPSPTASSSNRLAIVALGLMLIVGITLAWRHWHQNNSPELPDQTVARNAIMKTSQEPTGDATVDPEQATPDISKEGALFFDGQESYVRIMNLPYQGDSDLTIECRVTPLNKAFASVFGNNEQGGVGLGISTNGNWMFVVGQQQTGINPYAIAQATEQVELGKEVHVAAVFDRRTVKLFVDGKLQASSEWKGPFNPSVLPFWIGADPCPEAAKTSPLYRAFHGLIDELRVSSAARYTQDFEPVARFEPDPTTLLLYHFDEGPGPKIYDLSGHHRFGEPHGAEWRERSSTLAAVTPSSTSKPTAVSPQDQAKIDRRAAEWALRIGGAVKLKFADDSVRPITTMKDLPEGDFVVDEIEVFGNPRVTDADARRYLTGLTGLTSLQIHHTGITDATLEALRDSPTLGNLHLEATGVTDAGIKQLGTLPRLHSLMINNTKVTADCLPLLVAQPELRGLNLGSIPASEAAAKILLATPRWWGLGLNESWIHPDFIARLAEQPDLRELTLYDDLPVSRLRLLASLPRLSELVIFSHPAWSPEHSAGLSVIPQLDTLRLWNVKPSIGWKELAAARPWRYLDITFNHVPDEFFDSLDPVSSLATLRLWQTTPSRARLQRFRAEHPQVEVITDASRPRDRELAERLLRLGGISIQVVDQRGSHSISRLESLPDSEFELWSVYVNDCPAFDDRLLSSLAGLDSLRGLQLIKTGVTDAGLTTLDQLPTLTYLSLAAEQMTPRGLQTIARQPRLDNLTLLTCTVEQLQLLAPLKLKSLGFMNLAAESGPDVLERVAQQFPDLTTLGIGTFVPDAKTAETFLKLPRLKSLSGQSAILTPEVVTVLARHSSLQSMDLYGTSLTPWASLAPLQRIQLLLIGVNRLSDTHIERLAELPQLQTLSIDRTQLSPEALAAFAKLRHVATVQFTGCEITDADWTRITEALPNSRLLWNGQPRTR